MEPNRKLFPHHLLFILHGALVGAGSLWPALGRFVFLKIILRPRRLLISLTKRIECQASYQKHLGSNR
jgi:hypothetical protein